MTENNAVSLRKELRFKESKETFSIAITIENVSDIKKQSVVGFLDELYAKMRQEFLSGSAS